MDYCLNHIIQEAIKGDKISQEIYTNYKAM